MTSIDKINHSDCLKILNKSEKIIFNYGEGFMYESLPAKTRIIYPPVPLFAIENTEEAIENALENPLGCDPLSAQLKSGMKVTIAFDDLSLPIPPMKTPDLRQLIITKVLEKLGEAGVTDIHLIAAIGFHRKMTPSELKRILGKNIFNSFYPDKLYNHDGEDKENNLYLGNTEIGEKVELNRRVVQSDLVIYVNINLVSMDGGNKSFVTGLSTYESVRSHHNHNTLMNCISYMNPNNSALHKSCDRMGKIVEDKVNIFKIETTINNNSMPKWLTFLRKSYDQYNLLDRINLYANKFTTDLLPSNLKRKIFDKIIAAPYGLTGINAGRTNLVHEKTLENVYKQQTISIKDQADIMIFGLPPFGPYHVNSIMNPILFMCQTLGYCFNMYLNQPLIRKGGVYIVVYPLHEDFHPFHHPSYIDFYNNVLTDTIKPYEIEKKYEEKFAYNEKYIDLYRNSYAFHGVHPFYMWYWACYGMSYVGKVIVVKPKSKRPAEIMGFDTAQSIPEAIEKAKDIVGENPQITNCQFTSYFLWDLS